MVQYIAYSFCERVSFSQFAAYIRVTEARWHAWTRIDRLSKNREEEEEDEQHQGYILCLGYLATID